MFVPNRLGDVECPEVEEGVMLFVAVWGVSREEGVGGNENWLEACRVKDS